MYLITYFEKKMTKKKAVIFMSPSEFRMKRYMKLHRTLWATVLTVSCTVITKARGEERGRLHLGLSQLELKVEPRAHLVAVFPITISQACYHFCHGIKECPYQRHLAGFYLKTNGLGHRFY